MNADDKRSLAAILECLYPKSLWVWPHHFRIGFEGLPHDALLDVRDLPEALRWIEMTVRSYQTLSISPHIFRADGGPAKFVSCLYTEIPGPPSRAIQALNGFSPRPSAVWGWGKMTTAVWAISPIELTKPGECAERADEILETLILLAGALGGTVQHVRADRGPGIHGYQPTWGGFFRDELVLPFSYRGRDEKTGLPDCVLPILLPVSPVQRLGFQEIADALSVSARLLN